MRGILNSTATHTRRSWVELEVVAMEVEGEFIPTLCVGKSLWTPDYQFKGQKSKMKKEDKTTSCFLQIDLTLIFLRFDF